MMWSTAKQIIGKVVIRAHGKPIGIVKDIKFNNKLDFLGIIIEVYPKVQKENWWDPIIEIPSERIKNIGNYIIVNI